MEQNIGEYDETFCTIRGITGVVRGCMYHVIRITTGYYLSLRYNSQSGRSTVDELVIWDDDIVYVRSIFVTGDILSANIIHGKIVLAVGRGETVFSVTCDLNGKVINEVFTQRRK